MVLSAQSVALLSVGLHENACAPAVAAAVFAPAAAPPPPANNRTKPTQYSECTE